MAYKPDRLRRASKQAALQLLEKRVSELYSGDCQQANDLIYELELAGHTEKLITLISEALWQLR